MRSSLRVVALSPRGSYTLLSQYVADAALGDGDEDRVLSFLVSPPGPMLRRHLVSVTVTIVLLDIVVGLFPITKRLQSPCLEERKNDNYRVRPCAGGNCAGG